MRVVLQFEKDSKNSNTSERRVKKREKRKNLVLIMFGF